MSFDLKFTLDLPPNVINESWKPRPTVESIPNPFLQEESEFLVDQAKTELKQAALGIKNKWDGLRESGLFDVLITAEVTQKPQIHEFIDGERAVNYLIRYWGVRENPFSGQNVEVFHFVKPDSDESPRPSAMTIATTCTTNPNRRFRDLATWIIEDDREILPRHRYYFLEGQLIYLDQISLPNILFESDSEERQYASIASAYPVSGSPQLFKIELGLLKDYSRLHYYRYLGEGLAQSRNLRVSDLLKGEIELVFVRRDGIIEGSEPFSVSQVIANIANLQPATS